MKKNIFILTEANYPYGDAGGIRYHTIGKICASLGNKINVCCLGKDEKSVSEDEFNALTFYDNTKSIYKRLMYHLFFVFKSINELNQNDNIKAVIFGETVFPWDAIILKYYCRYRKISLIYSAHEWYSLEQFSSQFSWAYIKNAIYLKYIIPGEFIKVIAISRYLQYYFESKGNICTYMPVVMDVEKIPFNKKLSKNYISIIYAGAPGAKDYIKVVLDACSFLTQEELSRLRVNIIGVNRNQLISMCGVNEELLLSLHNSVKIYGRISHSQVLNKYESSDFSILIRSQSLRYAKAGFPTKFVESLATATPVICNITSDLGDFCVDGKNSLIVNGESAEAVLIALKRALALTYDDRTAMGKAARETAQEHFDYKLYINAMKKIV